MRTESPTTPSTATTGIQYRARNWLPTSRSNKIPYGKGLNHRYDEKESDHHVYYGLSVVPDLLRGGAGRRFVRGDSRQRNVYEAGKEVYFNFSGNPDYITFYSGEAGHKYEYAGKIDGEGTANYGIPVKAMNARADNYSYIYETAGEYDAGIRRPERHVRRRKQSRRTIENNDRRTCGQRIKHFCDEQKNTFYRPAAPPRPKRLFGREPRPDDPVRGNPGRAGSTWVPADRAQTTTRRRSTKWSSPDRSGCPSPRSPTPSTKRSILRTAPCAANRGFRAGTTKP